MNIEQLLQQISQLCAEAGQVKPAVAAMVQAIQQFGPEVKSLLVPIVEGAADIRIAYIKRLEAGGLDQAHAVALAVADGAAVMHALGGASTPTKKA